MLENYIKNHRKAFDQGPLPAGHQERFAQRIQSAKPTERSITIPLRRVWQVAAVVLVLCAVQTGNYFFSSLQPETYQPSKKVMTELADMEMYYGRQVKKEFAELGEKGWQEYDFAAALMQEMQALENEQQNLKETILNEGRNEYLIDALIQNYQDRIYILQRIRKIIQQTKTDHESEIIQSS